MAIGLDIGSSAVRVVQLEHRRGGERRLSHYGEVALPPDAVVDGDVAEPTVVADALRELWERTGLRRRTVAVGLASPRVTVRQLDLPDLPEAELTEAVRLQAYDQIPIPVDQALLDHVVVERSPAGEQPGRVRVLLVAAERDMVERLLAAVTGAKLRPARVDLDAFALVRSLARSTNGGEAGDQVELVVDIGASVTKIVVHRAGAPLFVRMVRLGGDAATRQLQKVLDLTWPEAEKAKLDASGAMAAGTEVDPDDERARALQDGAERVITEVRHSLEFFRTQQEDVEVGRVLLVGGGSLTPHLGRDLQAVLELPVEPGDVLDTFDAGPQRDGPQGLDGRSPCFAVPVGLAMGLLS